MKIKYSESFEIEKIYENIINSNMKRFAIPVIMVLAYLEENSISLEDYIEIKTNRRVCVNMDKPTLQSPLKRKVIEILGEEEFKKRKRFDFPNTFAQGFLACYYYLNYLNEHSKLANYIKNKCKQDITQNGKSFNYRQAGVISYFDIYHEIKSIDKYFNVVSESKTLRSDLYLISVWMMLISGETQLFNIDDRHFDKFIYIIKSHIKNYSQDIRISESKVNGIFYCIFKYIIMWWRVMNYAYQEIRPDSRFASMAPPKLAAKFGNILGQSEDIDQNLKYSFSLLENEKLKPQITDVYLLQRYEETHNSLVNGKINKFIKYYNYCQEKGMKFTNSSSVTKYINDVFANKNNRGQNEIINKLRGYFDLAIKAGYYNELKSNPVKYHLNKSSPSKYAKLPDEKVIPEREAIRLLSVLNKLSKFERLFILFMYYTGLRVGEVINLTVGCVISITNNILSLVVPPFKQREEPYIRIVQEKKLIEVINELIEMRGLYAKIPHSKTGELKMWLFVETTDEGRGLKHLNMKRGNKIIEKACKIAGIKKYTNHCFRHTYSHRKLYKEKYDPEDISALLGHSCPDTLMIYTHLTNEEKLIYYSKYLRRKQAIESLKCDIGVLTIPCEDTSYKMATCNSYNRWCGNGWCNSSGSTKCPKRYRSHYICPLFEPDYNRKQEIINDYYATVELLKTELSKENPIYQEVVFFEKQIQGIINNLHKINYSTKDIETKNNDIIQRAKKIICER
ncbi:tyrosine-type recombinase/integrase [Alkaliphilus peptidifermentans]|uniref:Phage integrase family protein n=1 Tax=Alkaliphilus peptidifermentans DSM 18978 TaxID=1120976 RepID=A0A1G5JHU1_9FIRM|nr:site-specific integrase [Alkaliphilus peptidifermentans]SCY87734.1 Phage integrase family protein [Alkaliphilus peptidifermentans DSM 18978]